MISYSKAEPIRAALQSTEMERRMMRIASPQLIILDGQFLNVPGQRVE